MHAELLIDGFFVGGPCDQSVGKQVIRSPYDNKIVGTAAEGGWTELRSCIDAAESAFETWKESPRHERQRLLRRISQLVRERHEELAQLLSDEVGKPISASRGEVDRLALTFDNASDLISTYGVESIPVNVDPRGSGYQCTVERFPRGVIFCIVPYNWPFNLTAHKVAPALATGNAVIVKPSPLAPLSTLTLLRLIHEAGCPPGVVNGWNGAAPVAQKALADPRIAMLSFTGSDTVGWKLKELMPNRAVTLELGGDASAIVAPDADIDWASSRIAAGAFAYAGQICISIQHALVADDIYLHFREKMIAATESCPFGDPSLDTTVCGPVISDEAADRIMGWINDAVTGGARILAGGHCQGRLISPTLLENVPPSSSLAKKEAFGPVLTIESFTSLEDAFTRVNRSDYGIQAGIFTQNLQTADMAFRKLQVGGVIVNDYPTLRFDNVPYGGVKRSGFGREGVRWAMDEMTEPKTLLVRNL